MDIDDAVGIGGDQVVRDEPQESGQHDEIDPFLPQPGEHLFAIVESIAVEYHAFHTQPGGTFDRAGLRFVRQHQPYSALRMG